MNELIAFEVSYSTRYSENYTDILLLDASVHKDDEREIRREIARKDTHGFDAQNEYHVITSVEIIPLSKLRVDQLSVEELFYLMQHAARTAVQP